MDVKFLVTFDADGAVKSMKAFNDQLDTMGGQSGPKAAS